MRSFAITAIFAVISTVVIATAPPPSETALLGELPPCGLACLEQEIPKSNCTATDLPCICTNKELNGLIALCVSQSCTIRESLTTKNVTSTLCGAPVRDRTSIVSNAGIIGGVVAVFFYILRMLSRVPQFGGGTLGLDDAVMTLVVALAIALAALSDVLAKHGLGKDMWTVPFDDITYILYIYYFDEDIYLSILPLTKISILLFYLRVFPQRYFRNAAYVAIALNVGYWIAFVLVSVFQCRPINAAWLRWDGEHPAKCQNINAQGWTSAVLNMALDILTMVLPLHELRKLTMSMRKKILVMIMFSLGIFVTLVSILRLHTLVEFSNTSNLTWDYVELGYWSTIEVDVGIICACLPAIRKLLWKIFPNTLGSAVRRGAKTPNYYEQRSGHSGGMIRENRRATLEDGDAFPLVEVTTLVEVTSHTELPKV
ncbi:integral membrane protein, putative [Talaromyces stipitatus ATCC 10500]|uniref:Integral membrane protein, putative n=1 Tax=Talaromyces stipitatus (strain ATCC 10500 / CBS 375.48 / QM 6759 / NRRL 1006) TaxID=441959 RepID=B8MBF9_TALSN|nr:integral membrane protein, putative [Talaromyces stipitatus ATCC 10500]EED17823.1 integral membrane protein, putative [Talaromyces stipitatus ATCC 10500]